MFRQGLRDAGIKQVFSAPGKPWQNGRIERLFWSLKEQLNLLKPADGNAPGLSLADFQFWYNEVRPHQALHGWTPMEAWRGVNPYTTAIKEVIPFRAWGGLLTGLYLRR